MVTKQNSLNKPFLANFHVFSARPVWKVCSVPWTNYTQNNNNLRYFEQKKIRPLCYTRLKKALRKSVLVPKH